MAHPKHYNNYNYSYNINVILFIEVWCNGSTKDFGSFSSGSNPDTSTNITVVGSVFIFSIL